MANQFEDLDVWKTAFELANLVYDLSDAQPFCNDFGLKNQMRRAAISVMSNIAEGFESQSDPMFRNYLGRAKASAGEIRAQLYLAHSREYVNNEQFSEVLNLTRSTSRQCFRLIEYLDHCIESNKSK